MKQNPNTFLLSPSSKDLRASLPFKTLNTILASPSNPAARRLAKSQVRLIHNKMEDFKRRNILLNHTQLLDIQGEQLKIERVEK